ncbi:MAG: Cysteine desulfurase IscS [Chlamydiia bacterium]|nr:Cysteine desulfurase IscS [Chlamydiia bacterium]
MESIYLDYNATTPLDPAVLRVMEEEMRRGPQNPSSVHRLGQQAKGRLNQMRALFAKTFGFSEDRIIFTGSGTEGMNMLIGGLRGHVISTMIEHACVIMALRRSGLPVTYSPVDERGKLSLEAIKEAITDQTEAIVLSWVNSETGVMYDLEELSALAHAHNVKLIIDGAQMLGKEVCHIPKEVDAICFSAHKVGGPKGVGVVMVRDDFELIPSIVGGAQEFGLRAGTENMPAIMGFAEALRQIDPAQFERMRSLRDLLEKELSDVCIINGQEKRVSNVSNLYFPNIDGETLMICLDQMGIYVSMGSACSAGAIEPSRVIGEMDPTGERTGRSIRISIGKETTRDEIIRAANQIKEVLRSIG